MAALLLGGCGLSVPEIKEFWDQDFPGDPDISKNKPPFSGTAQIEYEIRKRIFCELKEAVMNVNQYYVTAGETPADMHFRRQMIPDSWIAQISLSLEIDESAALNPGVTFNQVMANAVKTFGVGNTVTTAQSASLGFGATLSQTVTRTDKFDPTYSIAWLMKPIKSYSACHPENDIFLQSGLTPAQSSPFLIESSLGIEKWLMGAMLAEDLLPSQPPEKPAKSKAKSKTGDTKTGDTKTGGAKAAVAGSGGGGGGGGGGGLGPFSVSIEMKFVIISSGNFTPTWKLVNLSANTGSSPLFSTGRTRTHDLIITVGPDNADTRAAAYSLVLGNAVSNGVKAGTTPTP
jgi:hypothetical protein